MGGQMGSYLSQDLFAPSQEALGQQLRGKAGRSPLSAEGEGPAVAEALIGCVVLVAT